MIGHAGGAGRVLVTNVLDPCFHAAGGEGVIDPEPVATVAVPTELPPVGVAVAPEVAESGGLNLIHEVGRDIGGAGFVQVWPAGVEVAYRQNGFVAALRQGPDKLLPIRNFYPQVRHVDAVDCFAANPSLDHPPGFGDGWADRADIGETPAGGDQDTVSAARRQLAGYVTVAQPFQFGMQRHRRWTVAVFGQDQQIGIQRGQRGADRGNADAATGTYVPGDVAHG